MADLVSMPLSSEAEPLALTFSPLELPLLLACELLLLELPALALWAESVGVRLLLDLPPSPPDPVDDLTDDDRLDSCERCASYRL